MTKSEIKIGECHENFVPPHCKAIKKVDIAPNIRSVPHGSICFAFAFSERENSEFGAGSRKLYHIEATTMAPSGILMRKQRRQFQASIRAPPTRGAQTMASVKTPPMRPFTRGRLWLGKEWTTTSTQPAVTPLWPIPAITRPHMKAGDVGATVHKSEPASKMTRLVMRSFLVANKV